MKRSWFYVLFLILSFLIYVIWQNEKQMQLENLIGEKQEENERLNMKVFLLQDYFMLQYSYSGNSMINCTVHDESGKSFELLDLLGSDYKIVVYFSQKHCDSCIKRIVESLNSLMNKVSLNKILVIGEFENKRNFHAFKKGHDFNFPMYLINEQNNPNSVLIDENLPFICILNNEMTIKDLFIPIKELPDYMMEYYRTIIEKYHLNQIGD